MANTRSRTIHWIQVHVTRARLKNNAPSIIVRLKKKKKKLRIYTELYINSVTRDKTRSCRVKLENEDSWHWLNNERTNEIQRELHAQLHRKLFTQDNSITLCVYGYRFSY